MERASNEAMANETWVVLMILCRIDFEPVHVLLAVDLNSGCASARPHIRSHL
jgi:hypothetical protein